MTPEQFIKKWKASTLTERAAAQSHFNDLCVLLGEPSPTDADPKGEWYAFERGASKTAGGEGWADVWKRGHFAWENKGKRKDLRAAYAQLQQYAVALENPPLLVACDVETIEIHTNWTNTVHEVRRIGLEELREPAARATLKAVFTDPERLKPGQTRQALTEKAAREFAGLALRLRARGHDPQKVAHFVNRLVFCMFAEDVGLLPGRLFQRMLEHSTKRPEQFATMAAQLFTAMRTGGLVGFEEVAWFNGGLFDDDEALPLEREDIDQALAAARLDWAEIDPSILGTLFERGLDPDKRSQLGAHYTDRDKIMLIVGPVIVDPLSREWEEQKGAIRSLLERAEKARSPAVTTKAKNDARSLYTAFLERLRRFRVLDPACGSGNFLYLALLALKDIEHRVNLDAEALGFQRSFPSVGPEAVLGIEINPYAAELARVSVWIGEIQWMQRNGFSVSSNPILKPLDTIECRDALLKSDGTEGEWPAADAIIGNPPFLGAKEMRGSLQPDYLGALRGAFGGKVSARCDLVMYWFFRASRLLADETTKAVGLVATNKIRNGENLKLLSSMDGLRIPVAWSDLPWVLAGAAVRVSVVCLDRGSFLGAGSRLNGNSVAGIRAELVAESGPRTPPAMALRENRGVTFVGGQKDGPFDISAAEAARMLSAPLNPNGRPNSDVVRPWCNGMDLARRPSDTWIIDFGDRSLEEAQLYEVPFAHVEKHVAPVRARNNDKHRRTFWWQHGRPASRAKAALGTRSAMIATPLTSKHRWFVMLPVEQFPDNSVVVIARDDHTMLGLLSARFSVSWSLKQGNFLGAGNDPRYTPSTAFDTCPFPDGLTPNVPTSERTGSPHGRKIAEAAKRLCNLREAWLNPPDLVHVVSDVPRRLKAISDDAATILKRRTLTNLYNERPAWLANVHRELDEAVAAAYGWPANLPDDEVLSRLLALNLERAGAATVTVPD